MNRRPHDTHRARIWPAWAQAAHRAGVWRAKSGTHADAAAKHRADGDDPGLVHGREMAALVADQAASDLHLFAHDLRIWSRP